MGGSNHFEHFLAPVFEAPGAAAGHGADPGHAEDAGHSMANGVQMRLASAEDEAGGAAGHHHDPLEYVLMALSVLIALSGIGLAHLMYMRNPALPGALAARARGVYTLLYNKYWVDELYFATVVAGVKGASRVCSLFDATVVDGIVNGMGYLTRGAAWLGGAIDRYIVDGLVNFLGFLIRSFGSGISRLQTGVIQNYVLAVFGGVIVLILIMRLF